jgi:hypothetical protein
MYVLLFSKGVENLKLEGCQNVETKGQFSNEEIKSK